MAKKYKEDRCIIKVGDFKIGNEEINAILDVLKSDRITEGPKVAEFEKKWSEFVGTAHSILVNSGTSALVAGLLALKYRYNLPNGTKVVTSPVTYIATVNAIVLTGFKPVFVDIDPCVFALNIEELEEVVKKDENIKIIIPVHLMGYMNYMNDLIRICRDHDLILFEDAAQAHGSTYNGKRQVVLDYFRLFRFILHTISKQENWV